MALFLGQRKSPARRHIFSSLPPINHEEEWSMSSAKKLANDPPDPSVLSHIKHVVVLMFENRSFDHFLGDMPGVDGLKDSSGAFKPDVYNVLPSKGTHHYVPVEIVPNRAEEV